MIPLKIHTRGAATGPVLEITGDLDHATAPALRQCLATVALTPGQCLVLDLSGLDFCDSSGITALLTARSLATAQGADMALAAVPANTTRILRITGLDRVFVLHPDTETATRPPDVPVTGDRPA
ncbi:STAS domain-containing protein [Streptacidiphilus albus]|uniref:STAS domain-containing protein n=1 Tax=Streptacidiphilus albus TaxID=105425 RepID=UPI00054B11BB|nr:STAS domain-containing protein [Streptacidiphilus albus]